MNIKEELKEQFKYRVDIDKLEKIKKEKQCKLDERNNLILNYTDLSIQTIKIQSDIFDNVRKGTDKESSRPSRVSDLKDVTFNQQIPNYFMLFSAFKALGIIKEDDNIIKLLEYYKIFPKKKVDKVKFENFRNKYKEDYVSLCCGCINVEKKHCKNYGKCLFRKMQNELNQKTEKEQIGLLYKLGFPSNFMDIVRFDLQSNYYNISIQTLKNILEYFEMSEENNFVDYMVKSYNEIFLSMLNESVDEWKEEIEKQESIKKELKIPKSLEELRNLKNAENTLEIYTGYLHTYKSEEYRKRNKPYYIKRIEKECNLIEAY